MPLLGTVKEQASELPVSRVQTMKQQGYSNDQVVLILQRDGFSSDQIFAAMKQADMKTGAPQQPMNPAYEEGTRFSPEEPATPTEEPLSASTEEYVEAIIEEKWGELERDIQKIIDWKNRSEQRLTELSQKFEDLKNEFDKLHQAIIGKIGEYDKSIISVGAEIKAMEKVFQQILPEFTKNVSELSKITGTIKGTR